jgi:hypothetical protein
MSADRILQFELARLNAHLPERQITLKEALSSPSPHVAAKDGSRHKFERGELEFLSKMTPADEWDKLRLPILIAINPKLGRGAAEITGETEVKIISQVLGKTCHDPEMVIYRPEIAVVRAKLPTTTQYFFMVG